MQEVSEINARLFSLLNSRQRWQLGAKARGSVSLDELLSTDSGDASLQPADPGPGPQQIAESDQARALLEAALSRLEPRQRLLIRLRYQQDLTLDEVARLVKLPDPFRANREIQAALVALADFMQSEEP
jgi:RNA polymerase sigma factor (sigma-70 family)